MSHCADCTFSRSRRKCERRRLSMDENINNIAELMQGKWHLLIFPGIIFLLLLVGIVLSMTKGRNKNKAIRRNEINYYKENAFNWVNPVPSHSGNVSYYNGDLYYSRGNKSIKVETNIERTTVLTSESVSAWFEGRNYNYREEQAILNDIKNYLINNKICKNVIIEETSE